jgi:hypothetical protein
MKFTALLLTAAMYHPAMYAGTDRITKVAAVTTIAINLLEIKTTIHKTKVVARATKKVVVKASKKVKDSVTGK